MKIGITCYPTYGGSGAVATELALALAQRGHEIHVISYDLPFRLPAFAQNVRFHNVDMSGAYPLFEYFPYSLALSVKQHEVAIKEGLDALHVHYAVPHATAAFLARSMLADEHPLKVITTLHGTDITLVGQEASFFTVTKYSIEKSDAVTAVSAYLRDETHRAFGCELCGIEVIPNFINTKEYVPHPSGGRSHAFADEDTKVVTHISNFRQLKRVPEMVTAFAQVRKEVPARLILVGDGPERPRAEAEAERLGLQDDVQFLGQQNAIHDVLQGSDLFWLPSTSESFGLSALEAMACGVPVVASDVGGLPEVVVDGETGALAPRDDWDAFVNRSVELLKDRTLHTRVVAQSIAHAATFDVNRVVPQYEALYQRVIS